MLLLIRGRIGYGGICTQLLGRIIQISKGGREKRKELMRSMSEEVWIDRHCRGVEMDPMSEKSKSDGRDCL